MKSDWFGSNWIERSFELMKSSFDIFKFQSLCKGLILSLLFGISLPLFAAQSVTVIVLDHKTEERLPGAYVKITSSQNPEMVFQGITERDGSITFEQCAEGKYNLLIQYVGYIDHSEIISVAKNKTRFSVKLKEDAKLLDEVEVKQRVVRAEQKGDTTEFNAGAYKTNSDASTGDLLQKMPGVVNNNGEMEAQGEKIERVLVDGKPFFGDDPNAALKNLPAQVVDKVQVFDDKTDEAKMTGVDDGETVKTVNIVTKPGMNNGTFGRAFGAYGTDNHYYGGFNVNFFNQDRRITLLGQTNNINIQNFSSEDLVGVSATEGNRRGWGRRGASGSVGDFLVPQQGGISQTHAFGLNYTDQWSKKTKVNGSYFFNFTNNQADQDVRRQYSQNNSNQEYNEEQSSFTENMNHRLNFRLEHQLDSQSTILWRPVASFQQNSGNNKVFGATQFGDEIANTTNTSLNTALTGLYFENDLTYSYRFKKPERNLAISLENRYQNNAGDRTQKAENTFWEDTLFVADSFDQNAVLNNIENAVEVDVRYSEPISKKSSIDFRYEYESTWNQYDQQTKLKPSGSEAYDQLDTSLSSVFDNNYFHHEVGLGYRKRLKKGVAMARLYYQYAELNNNPTFPFTQEVNYKYHALLPMIIFHNSFENNSSLHLFFRSRRNAPQVQQLQNVLDNSNPLQLRLGNPNLQQENTQFLHVRFNTADKDKGSSFSWMLNGNYTNNYVANATTFASSDTTLTNGVSLSRGGQLREYVNLDGAAWVNTSIGYGFPLDKIKSNLNLELFGNYQRTPGLINGQLNVADAPGVGLNINLGSNISEKIDFNLSSRSSVSYVYNTLQTNLNTRYFNQNTNFRIRIVTEKGWLVESNVNHQYFTGLSAGFNQNFVLLNAGFGKKFLKGNKGELKITGFDLLNQNNSISRSVTETYVQDSRTTVLQQYFMLMFTYTIKKFPEMAKDGTPHRGPRK